MQTTDYSVAELDRFQLKLRDDLQFAVRTFDGQECYIVEDEVNSTFYRIGLAEYTFISLLDGNTTVAAALAATSAKLGRNAFSQEDAAAICQWLIQSNLAATAQSAQAARLLGAAQEATAKRRWQWLNPLMVKVPLFNPDRLVTGLMPMLRLFLGFPFFLVWTATLVVALYHLASTWDRATRASTQILARDNWLWLAIAWIALKICHEMFHALVCKRFGGNVREAGTLFLLFAPIPYVDVTSSWRFPSKWQRIATSAAGMYVELFIAAVAAIIWSRCDAGPLSYHAFNIMLLGSVTTVFFNANPLMRFDGYYILADLAELPNLYVRGQQYLSFLVRKYLLGVPLAVPKWRARKRVFVKVYGLASCVWRMMICVFLIVAAESLFYGAGVVLAFIALLLWSALPLGRFLVFIVRGRGLEQPNRVRCSVVCGVIVGLLVAMFVVVPWPGATRAPAVIDYEDAHVVRVAVPGFIRSINVQRGQRVSAGDVLAVMENPNLQAKIDELHISIRQTELRARRFHSQGDIAAEQVETSTRQAFQQRLDELRSQAEQLTVRAPIDGRVIADELDALLGIYLHEGGQLLSLADEAHKQLRVSIAQEDIDRFRSAAEKEVRVRLSGSPHSAFRTRLDQIEPRASSEIPHPALVANGGGPLPVRNRLPSSEIANNRSNEWELLTPHFLGSIQLNREQSLGVRVGQVATVNLRDGSETVGQHLHQQLRRWLREHLQSQWVD